MTQNTTNSTTGSALGQSGEKIWPALGTKAHIHYSLKREPFMYAGAEDEEEWKEKSQVLFVIGATMHLTGVKSVLTACTNKTGFRSCPEKFTECPAGLGEHSWVWHRGWEWLLCLHHPERGQPCSGCPWASAFHHTDMKEFHKGTLTAASRFMDRKDEPFILYLTSHNFIWACLWRDYSIIYSSTGCHQNNCNDFFPHGRSEMTLAVRFWIAQNLIRPTNISALTKQTSEKSCQRTLGGLSHCFSRPCEPLGSCTV